MNNGPKPPQNVIDKSLDIMLDWLDKEWTFGSTLGEDTISVNWDKDGVPWWTVGVYLNGSNDRIEATERTPNKAMITLATALKTVKREDWHSPEFIEAYRTKSRDSLAEIDDKLWPHPTRRVRVINPKSDFFGYSGTVKSAGVNDVHVMLERMRPDTNWYLMRKDEIRPIED